MKEEYNCKGVPYDGMTVLLWLDGILEFKVRNFKGYYDQQMNWVSTAK